MGNHFQLLATPATDDGMRKMMRAIGRSDVRRFNDAGNSPPRSSGCCVACTCTG